MITYSPKVRLTNFNLILITAYDNQHLYDSHVLKAEDRKGQQSESKKTF